MSSRRAAWLPGPGHLTNRAERTGAYQQGRSDASLRGLDDSRFFHHRIPRHLDGSTAEGNLGSLAWRDPTEKIPNPDSRCGCLATYASRAPCMWDTGGANEKRRRDKRHERDKGAKSPSDPLFPRLQTATAEGDVNTAKPAFFLLDSPFAQIRPLRTKESNC